MAVDYGGLLKSLSHTIDLIIDKSKDDSLVLTGI